MKLLYSLVIACGLAFGLTACDEEQQRIEITKSLLQVDSQLPDVPAVDPVVLEKVVFDFPRDTARKMIKNTPACNAREDKTSSDFVMTCTYYPILRKSNLFIGVDQPNFKKLNRNLDALIAQNEKLQARIAEVNRQRAEARGAIAVDANAGPDYTPTKVNSTLQLTQ
jgi:hypothetical protein